MKRVIVLMFSVLTATAGLAAEEYSWTGGYSAMNMQAGLDLGLESYNHTQIVLYPGGEVILFKPVFGGAAPLDIGAALRGRIGIPAGSGSLSLGGALYATFHLGFKGLSFPGAEYAEPLDYFASLGLALDVIKDPGESLLGFTATTGFNYFLTENLSVGFAYTNWKGYNGAVLSAKWRMGDAPEATGLDLAARAESVEEGLASVGRKVHLVQFYSFYLMSYFAGGFYFDDANYDEGLGTEWLMQDGDSAVIIRKALLREDAAGQWWRLSYSSGGEEYLFEFFVNPERLVTAVNMRLPGEAEIIRLSDLDGSKAPAAVRDARLFDRTAHQPWYQGQAVVETPAGSYNALRYDYDFGNDSADSLYQWWVSEEVPGGLVRYRLKEGDSLLTGELQDITRGNTTILDSF